MNLVTVGSRNVRSALADVDKWLKELTVVQCPGGSIDGFQVNDFIGRDLYVLGSFAAATLTSGAQTGTAGSGTTTTTMQKPTGAANWTSNDLRKKFLRVLSGGGASTGVLPTIRPIKSNTTTQLVVDAITGMDATTVFDIVDAATVVNVDAAAPLAGQTNCLFAESNTARVRFLGFKFTTTSKTFNVFSRMNQHVAFHGCHFAVAGTSNAVRSEDIGEFALVDCILSNGAQVSIEGPRKASVSRIHANAAAGISITDVHNVVATVDALSCTGNALSLKGCTRQTVALSGNSCGATPFVVEGGRTDITSLSGTGNTGFGADFSKGGVHNVNGATITGSLGDFTIDGISHADVNWTNAANFGVITRWGTAMVIGGNSNTQQQLDTLRVEGNFDLPALALVPNTGGTFQLGGRNLQYGYFHLAPSADTSAPTDGITAAVASDQPGAVQLGFGTNVISVCANAGDSVKLPAGAAVGGAVCHVKNLGAQSADVFPSTGGNIDALGTNNAFALAAGASRFFISRANGSGGKDWVSV